MKHVQLLGLIACATFFAGCESTEMANGANSCGTQETKRLAALRAQQQGQSQQNEAQQNLWNAQGNIVNRDGNPNRSYNAP